MNIQQSRLTTKYQATIPEAVRKAMDLKAGDTVAFDMKDGQVFLRKVVPVDYAYAEALSDTLSEWQTVQDDEAYRDL